MSNRRPSASPLPAAVPVPAGRRVAAHVLAVLGQIWAWLFLAVLVVFFAVTTPHFFDLFNFQAMGANAAVMLVLALGQTFVIITGGIDLSVGYVMGLATILISLTMQMLIGLPFPVVVLAGLAAGLVVGVVAGLINGAIIAQLRVPPFIATLGTLGIAQGLAYVLSGGPPVSIPLPGLGTLGNGYLVNYHPAHGFSLFTVPAGVSGPEIRNVLSFLPFQVLYAGLLTAILAWVLAATRFGRHVYAIGGSAKAALRAGIPVRRNLFKVYILSSVMATLAAFMYVLRYTGGVANSGDALMLSSIAAIVIGGASLLGGEGRVVGTLPYPGSPEGCQAVSRLAGEVPWAVLSAGVDHATFLSQIETAMAHGAKGVIAGRALWKDCIALDPAVTRDRLTAVALPRLREIQALIDRYADRADEAA